MAYGNAVRSNNGMRRNRNRNNAAQATHVQPVNPQVPNPGTTRPKPTSQFNPGPQQCPPCGPGTMQSGTQPNGCPRCVTPNVPGGGATTPGGAYQPESGKHGARGRRHGFLGSGQGFGDDQ